MTGPITNDYKPPQWKDEIYRESYTAPSGKVYGADSKDARVYYLLLGARRRGYRWPIANTQAKSLPGWVPAPVISQPWVAGQRSDRSCRELRAQGVAIQGPETHKFSIAPGYESKLSFWRLETDKPVLQSTIGHTSRPVPAALQIDEPSSTGPLVGVEIVLCQNGQPLESLTAFAGRGPVSTAEAYKGVLRDAYRSGELVRQLAGGHRLTVSADTVATLGVDPTTTLVGILPKLGARVRLEES